VYNKKKRCFAMAEWRGKSLAIQRERGNSVIIAVINNKGGTGKTTTCVNLSAAIANAGYRVLAVDLDSQASASLFCGIQWDDLVPSIADVLFEGIAIEEAIRQTTVPHLDLLTGGMELAHTDLILSDVSGRENLLTESLKDVRQEYDFILCDCPPSLSMLSVNALVAADGYIVPVMPEYLALEGLLFFLAGCDKIKEGMGIHPELMGIAFTMVSPVLKAMRKSTREIMGLIRKHYGNEVFKTEIRRDVRINESPSFGKSIFDFAPRSRGARAYASLAGEVMDRCHMDVQQQMESVKRKHMATSQE